jgi:hypothetical protein
MTEQSAPDSWYSDQPHGDLDPLRVTEILRWLAGSIGALSRATLFYRIIMGRHLIAIQKNELWRLIERRDYRQDPNGEPIWLNSSARTYTSWYHFIEEGFEHMTGLHRQTAYSAIKLAQSRTLSALSLEELRNFRRLANALELVAAERSGMSITPELIVQAQEMPIKSFRRAAQITKHTVSSLRQASTLEQIMSFLKAAVAIDPTVSDGLWAVIQDSMVRASEDPVRTVELIVTTYWLEPTKYRQSPMSAKK